MCGITAYCGNGFALPFLMQGLSKLEYRGYDSAGITILENEGLKTIKCKGRLKNLEDKLQDYHLEGHVGIGHTRWATHGIPSNLNSHPHTNDDETISLVHNGIIENYRELKEELIKKGYQFQSETDSEVVVHLLDEYFEGNLFEATKKVLKRIDGSYALCIVSTLEPDKIIVAKKDSPLIIGKSEDGSFMASDVPAILDSTRQVYYIDNMEIAELTKDELHFYNIDQEEIQKDIVEIAWDAESAEKGGFEHFMLKEIHEQPKAIKDTLNAYIKNTVIDFSETNLSDDLFMKKATFQHEAQHLMLRLMLKSSFFLQSVY